MFAKNNSDMNKIDLRGIIESRGLKIEYVGKKLFPTARYPYLAIKRILDGKAVLDADQISILSQLTGMTANDIFGNNWTASAKGGIINFTNGVYSADLNTDTWETKIYENGTLFHETFIHSEGIALSVYLRMLSKIIENKNK